MKSQGTVKQPDETGAEQPNKSRDWMKAAIIVMCWLLAGALVVLIATIYAASIVGEKACGGASLCSEGGLGSGPFGDAFGFATSLFTAMAFAGLVITMILQREELKQVREQGAAATKTAESTQETNSLIIKQQHRQGLEERFFRLIESSPLDRMSYPDPLDQQNRAYNGARRQQTAAALNKLLNDENLDLSKFLYPQSGLPGGFRTMHFQVSIWFAAWECTEHEDLEWLRDILDAKIDHHHFPEIFLRYFENLRGYGALRPDLIFRYGQSMPGIEYQKLLNFQQALIGYRRESQKSQAD